MDKKGIEKAIARGVEIVADFLPVKSYLYFPLLYSTCVWAVRRIFDYRERILGWQVWLEPGAIRTKPDEFIIHFFESRGGLLRVYETEVLEKDIGELRKAFVALYPIIGVEDPFLQGLFRKELEKEDYRKIVEEFAGRAAGAREDVEAASASKDIWKTLQDFGMEMACLGIHLISDDEVRKLIMKKIGKLPKRTS